MKIFTFRKLGRALLLSTAVLVGGVSMGWAQDSSSVPFVVNVDATVRAEPRTGAPEGAAPVQISVTGGEETVLRLPLLQSTVGVAYYATQRQANVPAIVNRAGKVSVNLPAESYKNAEVLLYTVNGKRVLRQKVSASSAGNNVISRSNIATGVYLLAVKGMGDKALTSRITHGGGGLDISVAFGNANGSGSENISASAPRLAKTAAALDWTIIVSATTSGYRDTAYTLRPTAATHAKQNITLRTAIEGTYSVRVSSVGTGASGSNNYGPGSMVSITAGTTPADYRFVNWTTESDGVSFANANNTSTTFVMPENTVVVTANFELIPQYAVIVESEGAGASGGGTYKVGTRVNITAGTVPAAQRLRFKNWTSESEGVRFAKSDSVATSFVMPGNDVTVTANFEPNTFSVTVVSAGTGAQGGGDYYPGNMVTIRAGTHPDGNAFKKWTTSNSNITFENDVSVITAFTMPSTAVTVTAVFDVTLTDSRDGKTYEVVTIGGKNWMAENLNYPVSGGSWCYGEGGNVWNGGNYVTISSAEIQANCNTYGRLYTWAAAKTACPSGWHLPSNAEWSELVTAAAGDFKVAGRKLKSVTGWNSYSGISSTDDFGFSALPGGRRLSGGSFDNVGSLGYWWTATEDGSSSAYYRDVNYRFDYVFEDINDRSYGHSVRCVQD